MSRRELGPEWVLSDFLANAEAWDQDDIGELAIVARRLWPRVQAHARNELTNQVSDDTMALATDAWESVLRSVAKTMCRSNGKGRPILNLEAYLFGAFHHRFNRSLRRERRRREMVEYLPLGRDLERLRHAHDSKAMSDLDRSIQVKQTIENMDDWTRTVSRARAEQSAMGISKRRRTTSIVTTSSMGTPSMSQSLADATSTVRCA
jgi:DNA-directed RNA polymerase specialized sigma24 family protein